MNKHEKIKLLIITPGLECGGTEKFVAGLCNHIDTDRFSVCLVVVNNSRPFYAINNAAVEVVDLKKSRVLFSVFAIKAAVKQFDPDIIFSTANHVNLYLAFFRKFFDARIRFLAREASIVSLTSRRAKFPGLYNWLIKKYYPRFDRILCQSAYMQQDLVGSYGISADKTVVIRNALFGRFEKTGSNEKKLPGRVYQFITVTRLREEKGVERLIQAVGLLSIPFRLYIIGDGVQRKALEKLVATLQLQDAVLFMGEKQAPFAGMENADLFLLGSYYEGFPNVLLEAGAYGIPVIAFDVPGGVAEIITDGENGILVADNDILAFASAINKGLQTPFIRDRIIEETKERYSSERIIPELEQIFISLCENK